MDALHGDQYSDHMVRTVTATEAKAKILALLDEVETGEEIEITRRGRTVARIVPARPGSRLRGLFAGRMRTNVASDEELFSPLADDWFTGWDWTADEREQDRG
jgi:prevent-host-death family protein